jgi:hypothetical protein
MHEFEICTFFCCFKRNSKSWDGTEGRIYIWDSDHYREELPFLPSTLESPKNDKEAVTGREGEEEGLLDQIKSLSIFCLIVSIWPWSSRASLVVTLAAMTGLLTPHALPRAVFDGTKT